MDVIMNLLPMWAWGLVFGGAFGFILHRVGASQPENIINMLRWKDLTILRFMLLAMAVGVVGVALLDLGGLANLSVKIFYLVGVAVGGGLLGLGFALSGYCPGTGTVALGEGRADAVPFVIGGLVGAGLYAWMYESIKPYAIDALNFGKMVLPDFIPLPALIIALVLGVVLVLFAFKLKECK